MTLNVELLVDFLINIYMIVDLAVHQPHKALSLIKLRHKWLMTTLRSVYYTMSVMHHHIRVGLVCNIAPLIPASMFKSL